jgi:hypothetical protein
MFADDHDRHRAAGCSLSDTVGQALWIREIKRNFARFLNSIKIIINLNL